MRTGLFKTRAVLFDLDGTLLDTARDMAAALNELRQIRRMEPLPFETIRPLVSQGAPALVRLAFPLADPATFAELRARFLEIYSGRLAVETRPYEGVLDAIARLESRGVPWGVVTNKPGWLTEPLLRELDLVSAPESL